jgi:hypothetical protein
MIEHRLDRVHAWLFEDVCAGVSPLKFAADATESRSVRSHRRPTVVILVPRPGNARLVAVALAILASAAVVLPAAAKASAPTCPPEIGGLRPVVSSQGHIKSAGNQDVLQCPEYLVRTGGGGTVVTFDLAWQVKPGNATWVDGAPCSGQDQVRRDDASGSLSIASGTHKAIALASAETTNPSVDDGRTQPSPVPPAFNSALAGLLAQAETVALSCDASVAPAASDSGSPTEPEILLATGLIMTLLGGLGPQLLAGLLKLLPNPSGPVAGTLLEAAVGDPNAGLPSVPDQPAAPVDGTPLQPASSGNGANPPGRPPPSEPPAVPVATPAQIGALQGQFAGSVQQRLDEGYWVRNPDLLSKAWNTVAHPFWGSHSGQCGEFAANGVRWMTDYVQQQFGPGAIVDEVYVARRSVFVHNPDFLDELDAHLPMNHAATRVILPDGRRYVMDFWDAMGPSKGQPPRLVPEGEWAGRWSQRIPSGQISRTEWEQQLREHILTMGENKGIKAFRLHNAKTGDAARAETLINSWRVQPW